MMMTMMLLILQGASSSTLLTTVWKPTHSKNISSMVGSNGAGLVVGVSYSHIEVHTSWTSLGLMHGNCTWGWVVAVEHQIRFARAQYSPSSGLPLLHTQKEKKKKGLKRYVVGCIQAFHWLMNRLPVLMGYCWCLPILPTSYYMIYILGCVHCGVCLDPQ